MAERTIVQYGIYQFDDVEKRAYRLRVMSQVIRHPTNESLNLKYQKHKSFYGYAQLMNNGFVHQSIPIEYEYQCLFEYFAHDNLNTLYNSALQYGTLLTISNAVQSLGGGGLLIVGSTLPLFPMPYDRMVFKLFNNTTLLVFTEVVTLPDLPDIPQQFDDESASPTDPSSTQPEPNPLDEGYDIPSNPYEPETDDNGESYDPERPVIQPTGTFTARVVFTNSLIAPGEILYENTLTNPSAAPERQYIPFNGSGRVRLVWGYEGGQWLIDQTDSSDMDLLNGIQIISYELIPIP